MANMISRKLFRSCLVCIFVVAAGIANAWAGGEASVAAAWQAVKAGETVVLMRHAIAPGIGDPQGFDIEECSTQRNLSEAGRKQASAIGDVLRASGIDQAQVLSSQWCRCLETAQLLDLGDPQPTSMLNSFFEDRLDGPEQTRALKESLREWSNRRSGALVMVTHQVNITALTGQFVGSGDMLIITIMDDEPTVLARISTK